MRVPPFRPIFLYAGVGTALLAAVVMAWPSAESRRTAELERLRARAESGAAPSARERLLELAAGLRGDHDERGVEDVARALLRSPGLGQAELSELSKLAFHDLDTWNGRAPEWKTEVFRRWRDSVPEGELKRRLSRHEQAVDFELSVRSAQPELYLAGSWNEDGELDDLGGWRYRKAARGADGVHRLRLRLRRTTPPHRFFAVARTRPWPEGRAIAQGSFAVHAPGAAALSPVSAARAPAASSSAGPKRLKTAVLLMDGGSWHALAPLVHQGLLPNFARFLPDSARATLEASGKWYPSEPNIFAALTGTLPHRHRVLEYFTPGTALRTAPIWKIASDHGRSVLVINIPNTFPVWPLRGRMISEALFAVRALRDSGGVIGSEVYRFAEQFGVEADQVNMLKRLVQFIDRAMSVTHPDGLRDSLAEHLPAARLAPQEGVVGMARVFDSQLEASLRRLLGTEPSDLGVFFFQSLDAVHHSHWTELESGRLEGSPLLAAYQRADALLGYLMASSEQVLLFSDHGGGPAGHRPIESFNFARLLQLQRRYRPLAAGVRVGLSRDPETWYAHVDGKGADAAAEEVSSFLSGARYLPQRQPMFTVLRASRDPNGMMRVAFRFEQPRPPVIRAVEIGGREHAIEDALDISSIQGVHMGNGMIAAWGPGVRPGPRDARVHVVDVAPTALYMLGLPAGRDMDGRVWAEAFAKERLDSAPPRLVRSHGGAGWGWWRLLRALRWRSLLSGG